MMALYTMFCRTCARTWCCTPLAAERPCGFCGSDLVEKKEEEK